MWFNRKPKNWDLYQVAVKIDSDPWREFLSSVCVEAEKEYRAVAHPAIAEWQKTRKSIKANLQANTETPTLDRILEAGQLFKEAEEKYYATWRPANEKRDMILRTVREIEPTMDTGNGEYEWEDE